MKNIIVCREEISAIVEMAVRRGINAAMRDMGGDDRRVSLKPDQAAAYLGQSPNTLRQWRCQGRGPAYEKRGRSVRYKLSDLDAWRDANRVVTGEALESLVPEASRA